MGNLEYCKMTEENAIEMFKKLTDKTPRKEDIDNMDFMRLDLVEYYKSVIKKCNPKKYFTVFLWRKREFDEAMKELEHEDFFEDKRNLIQIINFGGCFMFSARKKDLENNDNDIGNEFLQGVSMNEKKSFEIALDLEFGFI